MWKRRRRYRDQSMRYPSQPFDNERQYYSGFASGRPYIKDYFHTEEFKMPYSYKPNTPKPWSPYRKYANPFTTKKLKRYDDTIPEVRQTSTTVVPREYAEPSMKLYQPGYERHLAAFKKSSSRIKNYKQMLANKQLRKDLHNKIWGKLDSEYKRIDKIMQADPFVSKKDTQPMTGRTAKEFYKDVEDKENTRLITYRPGDTMTVAKMIEQEERDNQPRQVTYVDEPDVVETRIVQHQQIRNDQRNKRIEQQRVENEKRVAKYEHDKQVAIEAKDQLNAVAKVVNNAITTGRNLTRNNLLQVQRAINASVQEHGLPASAQNLQEVYGFYLPPGVAKSVDDMYIRLHGEQFNQMEIEPPVRELPEPPSRFQYKPIKDGDVPDSSKSIVIKYKD